MRYGPNYCDKWVTNYYFLSPDENHHWESLSVLASLQFRSESSTWLTGWLSVAFASELSCTRTLTRALGGWPKIKNGVDRKFRIRIVDGISRGLSEVLKRRVCWWMVWSDLSSSARPESDQSVSAKFCHPVDQNSPESFLSAFSKMETSLASSRSTTGDPPKTDPDVNDTNPIYLLDQIRFNTIH